MVVGAQIYTLVVEAVTSTLGVGAGTLMWLWGHRYTVYTLVVEAVTSRLGEVQ